MNNLLGKVALVTGAGGERGFGRAIAVRLAQEGADLIINDIVQNPYSGRSSSWRGLDDLVQEITALGRRAVPIVADVSDAMHVEKMVQDGIKQLGHIDILVSNAASSHGRDLVPVVDLDEDVWDSTMRVNLKGAFLCCKFVAREMIARGLGGKIIVMSSAVGKRGQACRAAYAVSKFGLIGLTQSLALELAPRHINVNALCPGMADTERINAMAAALASEGESAEDHQAKIYRDRIATIPLARLVQTADIASLAAFLASPQSDYLTGLSIPVSGGTIMD
jgi:3-oxoacyl-[acyl-carrier protein] reductase/meso-butanediol dehydrogenase/(S,S)-butanediol dehydrogenase/diacetyl reductase